ncbi:MAG: hypothetical protein ACMXYA_02600 [Candidatus Woesearchaeota archaeon]
MSSQFVSLSGISSEFELEKIRSICDEEGISFPVVIGFQVSHSSINRGTQNDRQPLFSDLGTLDALTRKLGFQSAIHYYTKNIPNLVDDLECIEGVGVDCSQALFQFNTLPPLPVFLAQTQRKGFSILYKVAVANTDNEAGGYAVWMEDAGTIDARSKNVQPLLDQVKCAAPFISYAMFDPSHGTDFALDLQPDNLAILFGEGVMRNHPKLGLVYAGGVKPNTAGQICQLLQHYFPSRASIDIETGIHTGSRRDFDKIREYLVNCRGLFE